MSTSIAHFRQLENFRRLFIHFGDDLRRRLDRRQQQHRAFDGVARHAGLRDRRQIGHHRRALGGGHGKRPQPFVVDVRNRRRRGGQRNLRLIGDDTRHRRSATLVRHADDIRFSHELEQLGGKVHVGADAGMRVGHLARICLGVSEEILHGRCGHAGMHHHHVGIGNHRRDGDKFAVRRVAQLRVEAGADGDGAFGRDQEGVSVRRGLGHDLAADIAACTAAIVDDDGLFDRFLQVVGENPRGEIRRAAGRERHDDAYRPLRPGLVRGCLRCDLLNA
jgi:hypothetical protein